MDKKREIVPADAEPRPTFNLGPTGHKVPDGRSPDDPAMTFTVPDCGIQATGVFQYPYVLDPRDLPSQNGKGRRQS